MSRFAALLEDFFYRPDEELVGLFDVPVGPEELPLPIEEEALEEFIAFDLEAERYAVPIREVREILKVPPLTELPRAEPHLLGLMSLRGELIPVHDVKVRLGLASAPPKIAGPAPERVRLPRTARVMVVHGEEGDAALLVDAVREVVRLRPSMIEPRPPGVGRERDGVVGLGRHKEALYILLDLAEVL
ncbi:MAG: chemotaxis protein CheW [Myxococcota bacterium]